ncbi:MAG: hypothetical protein RR193_03335, partial [Christensenellaceae bacterium]
IDEADIFKVTVSLSVKHIRFERYGFQKDFVSGALVRVWYAFMPLKRSSAVISLLWSCNAHKQATTINKRI